jgi:hypothetical protein
MNSYVQTKGKVPEFRETGLSLCRSGRLNGGETHGAIHYIVASVRLVGLLSDHLFDVRHSATAFDQSRDRKTRILRGLEERLRAGNLFVTGHFLLPCGIQ